jgi:hypothetical protein
VNPTIHESPLPLTATPVLSPAIILSARIAPAGVHATGRRASIASPEPPQLRPLSKTLIGSAPLSPGNISSGTAIPGATIQGKPGTVESVVCSATAPWRLIDAGCVAKPALGGATSVSVKFPPPARAKDASAANAVMRADDETYIGSSFGCSPGSGRAARARLRGTMVALAREGAGPILKAIRSTPRARPIRRLCRLALRLDRASPA